MTKDAPTLDLCKKHSREVRKMFRPRGIKPGPQPGSKHVAKRKGNYGHKEKYAAMWEKRKIAAMAFFNKTNGPVTSKEVHKALGDSHSTGDTLRRLIAEKKIKREGWAEGTRWSLC